MVYEHVHGMVDTVYYLFNQGPVLKVKLGSLELATTLKGGWRCALEDYGEQSVMIHGMILMRLLYAGNYLMH